MSLGKASDADPPGACAASHAVCVVNVLGSDSTVYCVSERVASVNVEPLKSVRFSRDSIDTLIALEILSPERARLDAQECSRFDMECSLFPNS
jgi:hypothetical protein